MKRAVRRVWALLAVACLGPVPLRAAAPEQITLVCDAVYLPARSSWTREVRFVIDGPRIRRLEIDGVPVYSFAVDETLILTALDNERIQIDTATLTWRSDFRGQASAEGRCERR